MHPSNVLAVLPVDDFLAAESWYRRLFDREPDRRPMSSCAEWQLTDGGAVQVIALPDAPRGVTVVLGVDDADARAAELTARGIEPRLFTTPDGQFRLASCADPAGNTVVLGQTL
ncbi:VOC family protein [Geodermatophilus sp. SYSU D00804]